MIVLDTDVISALMNPAREPRVIAWLDLQPRSSIWITSITVLEVQYGLRILPAGKRRTALIAGFDRLLSDLPEGRVAAFDTAAAEESSELMSMRGRKGGVIDLRDTMIAGIVPASHATLATRNTKQFEDLGASVVNPWLRSGSR